MHGHVNVISRLSLSLVDHFCNPALDPLAVNGIYPGKWKTLLKRPFFLSFGDAFDDGETLVNESTRSPVCAGSKDGSGPSVACNGGSRMFGLAKSVVIGSSFSLEGRPIASYALDHICVLFKK
jgi:hypothetical protein